MVGVKLLNFILPSILQDKIQFKNQSKNKVTYDTKISTGIRKLDFNKTIEVGNNKVRDFTSKQSEWFFYNIERNKIIEVDFEKGDRKC